MIHVVQVIAVCVIVTSLIALAGILFGHMAVRTWGSDIGMALPTATNFVLLAIAVLLLTLTKRKR